MTLAFTITGICLLAIYSVYFFINRKISRILDSEKILSKINEEINGFILELNQTTERNILLIEDKIEILSTLIKKSDNAILLLDKKLYSKEVEPMDYSHLAPKHHFPISGSEGNESNLDANNEIIELFQQGFSADIIASKMGKSIGEIELVIAVKSPKSSFE